MLGAEAAAAKPTLFFSANDGRHGFEPWRSNGKGSGTHLVKDVLPGRSWSAPDHLTPLAGKLYFTAVVGYEAGMDPERELWSSNGTSAGTRQIATTGCNSGEGFIATQPSSPVSLNGSIFFTSCDETWDDDVYQWGRELWRSDGTSAGTQIVKDINPDGSAEPTKPLVVGDSLFFGAWDGVNGHELWVSDGTGAGTRMVEDVGTNNWYVPETFPVGAVQGIALFVTDDGVHGRELWRSDGTPEGTYMVEDINPVGSGIEFESPGRYESTKFVLKAYGALYFPANDGVHGTELWRSDGTPEGTYMIADVNPSGSSRPGETFANRPRDVARRPQSFARAGGLVYFSADDGRSGLELWRTDGTENGTWRVKNVNRTPRSSDPTKDQGSFPGWLVGYRGGLLFAAESGRKDVELWTSNGTGRGTYRLRDINPGGPSYPGDLTRFKNRVFFRARTEGAGSELWRTDGTRAGTRLFADIHDGRRSSEPVELTVVR